MKNPICSCGAEATWIDNGPRLQYHYCRKCKVEVVDQPVNTCKEGAFPFYDGMNPAWNFTLPTTPPPGPPPAAKPSAPRIVYAPGLVWQVTAVDLQKQMVYVKLMPQHVGSLTYGVPLADWQILKPLNPVPSPGYLIANWDFSQYPVVPKPTAPLSQMLHIINTVAGVCSVCGASPTTFAAVQPCRPTAHQSATAGKP